MGNATGMVVFFSMLSLVVSLFTLSIQPIDPCNPILLSSHIFTSSNVLIDNLHAGGYGGDYYCSGTLMHSTYSFDNSLSSQVGSNITRGTTTAGTSSGSSPTPATIFPDWLFTGFNWLLSAGQFVVNIIGLPFTFAMVMIPNSTIASLIGASFSIILLFMFVNYIRGSDT